MPSSTESTDTSPPQRYDTFGDLSAVDDLARASKDINEIFVETSASREFLRHDPPYSAVVGAKGTGKSLLLFKKMLMVRAQPGVLTLPRHPSLAFAPAADFANLVEVTSFWQLFEKDGKPRMAAWVALWEWALLNAVLAGWLSSATSEGDKTGRSLLDRSILNEITSKPCADPFECLAEFLGTVTEGYASVRGKLKLPSSKAVRDLVVEQAWQRSPTYVFIDNQDDFFEESPAFWIASAIALLRASALIRTATNHRVRVVMTLRPEVLTEFEKFEAAAAFGASVFKTRWSDVELMRVFANRIRHLREDLLLAPQLAAESPLVALLGEDLMVLGEGKGVVIRNVVVETDPGLPLYESAERYFLRHTLRRPRDIILMGNEILSRLQSHAAGARLKGIQTAVVQAASAIGMAYIHEVERLWPWQDNKQTSLLTFIQQFVPRNILTFIEAMELREKFARVVGQPSEAVHPFSVLASLGLAGYPVWQVDSVTIQHFEVAGQRSLEQIPDAASHILIHPVLYGARFHVEPVRGVIVGPGLPFDASQIVPRATSFPPTITSSYPPGVSPFPPPPVLPRTDGHGLSWVHLSDLHFGAGSTSHRFDHAAVMKAILGDLEAKAPKDPDFVFVTGDIAFSAGAEQFDEAAEWFGRIAKALKIPASRVHFVPGNHDVHRLTARQATIQSFHTTARHKASALDDLLVESTSRDLLASKLAEYRKFVTNFHSLPAPLRSDELDWVKTFSAVPGRRGALRLVGLCSVWVSDEFDGMGQDAPADAPFVPNLVLAHGQLARPMKGAHPDELVLLLSHHPPEWMPDWSAKRFNQELGGKSHLHLCGHVHSAGAWGKRRFGSRGTGVRYVAGAAHGDASEASKHGYSWGAVRHNAQLDTWQAGWAPRVYAPDWSEMVPMECPLGQDGFAWESIDVRWPKP